jgi:endonuclease G
MLSNNEGMKYFFILFLLLASCATTQKDLAQQDTKSLSKIDGSKNSSAEIEPAEPVEPVQPTAQQPEIVLKHKYFTISYNSYHRLANWVKYSLKKEDLNGQWKRPSKFKADPILKKLGIDPVVHDDYTHSGYARGHLAPAEDFAYSKEAIESTFIMSNVIPQKGSVNSGSWAQLEKKVRKWACGELNITVYTGPILKENLPKIKNQISVPDEFFKLVIDETPPKKAIAFRYNQKDKKQSPSKNQIKTNEVFSALKISFPKIKDSSLSDWKECG